MHEGDQYCKLLFTYYLCIQMINILYYVDNVMQLQRLSPVAFARSAELDKKNTFNHSTHTHTPSSKYDSSMPAGRKLRSVSGPPQQGRSRRHSVRARTRGKIASSRRKTICDTLHSQLPTDRRTQAHTHTLPSYASEIDTN